jgi:hypothetical protein
VQQARYVSSVVYVILDVLPVLVLLLKSVIIAQMVLFYLEMSVWQIVQLDNIKMLKMDNVKIVLHLVQIVLTLQPVFLVLKDKLSKQEVLVLQPVQLAFINKIHLLQQ